MSYSFSIDNLFDNAHVDKKLKEYNVFIFNLIYNLYFRSNQVMRLAQPTSNEIVHCYQCYQRHKNNEKCSYQVTTARNSAS